MSGSAADGNAAGQPMAPPTAAAAGGPALAGTLAGALAGRLRVCPGQPRPLSGGRPVLDGPVLQRVVGGLDPAQLPARLSALFSLCGAAHRLTAARAVRAALGEPEPAGALGRATWQHEDRLLRLWTAREHLQRLALDLPQRVPVEGVAPDGAWLRGHPLAKLPLQADAADAPGLQALVDGWQPWLEASVLGGTAVDWLRAWRQERALAAAASSTEGLADGVAAGVAAAAAGAISGATSGAISGTVPGAVAGGAAASGPSGDPATDPTAAASPAGPLDAWSATRPQPVMRWLHGAAAAGRALHLPCRPLGAEALSPGGLRTLASALDGDAAFARHPVWGGEPAETGCWTRLNRGPGEQTPHNAWMRWQYRMAELVALAQPGAAPVLCSGALALGEGHGLAWTEMSRGLLVHVVRLGRRAGVTVVETCRVLAPTEWNFHPEGGLARALAAPGLAARVTCAALAALDPCVEVELAGLPGAADA